MNALQTLDQCRARLEVLVTTVDRCRTPTGSTPTSPKAPPSTPCTVEEDSSTMSANRRAHPRCHDCHGPLGASYHGQHPHGLDICPLEHYELCVGGIVDGKDKGGHMWRGCPGEFNPPEACADISEETGHKEDEPSDGSVSNSDESYRPSREPSPCRTGKARTRSASAHESSFQPGQDKTNTTEDIIEDPDPKLKPGTQDNLFDKAKLDNKTTSGQTSEEVDHLLAAELAEITRIEEETKKREHLV